MQDGVEQMIAHGVQLVDHVIPAEGEDAERPIRLVRLFLQAKRKNNAHWLLRAMYICNIIINPGRGMEVAVSVDGYLIK